MAITQYSEGGEREAAARHNGLWRRLRGLPLVPLAAIVMLLAVAVAAPWIAPYPPTEQNLLDRLQPPFWVTGGSLEHILGTDHFGRDVLSRVLYGARVSLSVAIIAIVVAGGLGTLVGIVAGYFSGVLELVLMRVVDAFLAVPAVLVAIVLASTLGPSFENVVLVIGLLYWPR